MTKATVNGVTNYYGPRNRYEGVGGTEGTKDDVRHFVLDFGGSDYTTASGTLPAGATIVGNALVEVREVFALGGTTPTINVGVSGSHGTNYLGELSEAQAEALGTYSVASAGTLAVNTPLAAAVTIVVGLDGTSPTITAAGKARLVIPYLSI
jgi:hypothetical protein